MHKLTGNDKDGNKTRNPNRPDWEIGEVVKGSTVIDSGIAIVCWHVLDTVGSLTVTETVEHNQGKDTRSNLEDQGQV